MISFLIPTVNPNIHRNKLSLFLFAIAMVLSISVSLAAAAQVELAWDANDPTPEGYQILQRLAGEQYDYTNPVWPTDGNDHTETSCSITNLTPGVTYYFVVRAYSGDDQSCDSNEISYTVPAEVTLSAVTISGPGQLNENTGAQYTCTAHYSDGSTAPLTSGVTWSDNSAVTSISSGGWLTAADVTADTSVNITAGYGGKTASHSVTVKNNAPTLSSITISGPTQLNENTGAQYTCTAHYSDGSNAPLASGVTWSDNSAATNISSGGWLTAANVTADTSVNITAGYGGKNDSHSVTVKNIAPTLSSITISGPTQLNENTGAQYTLTAHYSDGSTTTPFSGITWRDNSTAAAISAGGWLAAAYVTSDTSVTLTARYGGKTDTHTVAVKNVAPKLSYITIDGPIQVNEKSSAQYACTANYSDGSTTPLSSSIAWSDNSPSTSISTMGLLTTSGITSDTTATITATYGGKTDTHSVTVKKAPAVLTRLSITGPTQLNEGSSAQYVCTAHYADNTNVTVTDSVNWRVNSDDANISAAGQLVAGAVQDEKRVTITASFDGKQADHDLTIHNSNENFTLTVDILGSGSVQLDPPGGTYEAATVVTLTAEADHAYAFDGWMGSVADTESNITTVVVDADISLSVTFLEDTDLDSVPDSEEWGIDSQDTHFDGNSDGIADYLQSNVASMHTNDHLQFITMSVPVPGKITSCKMKDPATMNAPPTQFTFPLGLIDFQIENITPGDGTSLTIHLPTGSQFDTYYKYGATVDNPTADWYEFMYDPSSDTGAVYDGDTVTLYLKDGQSGDDDLTANGVITDPGGPVILPAGDDTDQDSTPTTGDENQLGNGITTGSGSSGGCFINMIFN